MAEADLRVVQVEMTVSDIVPKLTGFRDLAASYLAAARAEMTSLAAESSNPALQAAARRP